MVFSDWFGAGVLGVCRSENRNVRIRLLVLLVRAKNVVGFADGTAAKAVAATASSSGSGSGSGSDKRRR